MSFKENVSATRPKQARRTWLDNIKPLMPPEDYAALIEAVQDPGVSPTQIYRALLAERLDYTPSASTILNWCRETRRGV